MHFANMNASAKALLEVFSSPHHGLIEVCEGWNFRSLTIHPLNILACPASVLNWFKIRQTLRNYMYSENVSCCIMVNLSCRIEFCLPGDEFYFVKVTLHILWILKLCKKYSWKPWHKWASFPLAKLRASYW